MTEEIMTQYGTKVGEIEVPIHIEFTNRKGGSAYKETFLSPLSMYELHKDINWEVEE